LFQGIDRQLFLGETNFWLCVAAAILSFILLITGIIMMSKSKKMKKRKKNCCKGWGVALFVIGLLGLATSVSLGTSQPLHLVLVLCRISFLIRPYSYCVQSE